MVRTSVFSLVAALALVACGDDFDMLAPTPNARPMWLWTGSEPADAPPCPGDWLPLWEGWANEVASADCGSCECQPGSCLLAPTVTAQAPICADGVGPPIRFDAGDGWNGTCAAPAPAIPASAFGSVIYGPPALAPCTPSPTLDPPPITGTFARACEADPHWVQPVDTALCIRPEEDGSCAEGFRTRRDFATQRVDNRTCTPCECGEPSGGKCTARVTLYADATCGAEFDSSTLSNVDAPLCQDITVGAPLAAIRAELTELIPAACAPKHARSIVIGTVERPSVEVACCAD